MSLRLTIPRTGAPEVLRVEEGPAPHPGPGEVRVRVDAVGVNFADVMMRIGLYPDAPPFPFTPGYEAAGVVDAVGEGVDPAREGEPVLALARHGCYAEHVCVPQAFALRRPDGVGALQGAALAVNWLTAYQMLEVMAPPRPGETVLVHGAAGGVGLAAVRLAQRRGAHVLGSASPAKHAALHELGVGLTFDSRRTRFAATVRAATGGRGADVVLEPRHGAWILESYRAAAPAGRVVLHGFAGAATGKSGSRWSALRTLAGVPWLRINPLSLMNDNKALMGVNLARMWDQADRLLAWLRELLDLAAAGEIVSRIDSVYGLADAAAAHHRLQDRANIGKVLLATPDFAARGAEGARVRGPGEGGGA